MKKQVATRVHFPIIVSIAEKRAGLNSPRSRTPRVAGIWRICFSSVRYARNPLASHIFLSRTQMRDRSGDADRPRLLRRNEIKIGDSRSRVLQTRHGENTSNSDCGEIPDRTEESWRGRRRRVRAIRPIRESRLPFLAPSQRSCEEGKGRKLNNSLSRPRSRRFSGIARRLSDESQDDRICSDWRGIPAKSNRIWSNCLRNVNIFQALRSRNSS